MIRIAVVPVGDVPADDIETASDALEDAYGVRTIPLDERPLPEVGHDSDRDQYDVGILLDVALDAVGGNVDAILGVTDADVFYRRREFVFGSSYLDSGRAVFSTHRLGPPGPERRRRVRRQAIKQVAHSVGLEQCDNDCVLQFSPTVHELDRRPERFCTDCHAMLPRELGGGAAPVDVSPDVSGLTLAEWRQGVGGVVLTPFLWLRRACHRLPVVGRRVDSVPVSLTLREWVVAILGLLLAPLVWLYEAWLRTPTFREWLDGRPEETRRLVHGTVGALSSWVKLGVFAVLTLATLQAELELYPLLTGSELTSSLAASLGVFVLAPLLGVGEYVVLTGLLSGLGAAKREARRQSNIE